MNRQEKIDFIYEKIADKTLSFWCIIRRETGVWDILDFKIIQNRLIKFDNWKTRREIQLYHSNSNQVWLYNELDDKEIIWHPVMLGDVLDYLWDKKWLMTIDKIIRHWEKKRLPIEDQDDGFIDYIYRTLQ